MALKRKKHLTAVILMIIAAMFCVVFTSCGDKAEEQHTHSLNKHAAVAATCTTDGNIEYWTCDCGKYFSDGEGKHEVSASEIRIAAHHDYINGICSVCQEENSDYKLGDIDKAAWNNALTIRTLSNVTFKYTASGCKYEYRIDCGGEDKFISIKATDLQTSDVETAYYIQASGESTMTVYFYEDGEWKEENDGKTYEDVIKTIVKDACFNQLPDMFHKVTYVTIGADTGWINVDFKYVDSQWNNKIFNGKMHFNADKLIDTVVCCGTMFSNAGKERTCVFSDYGSTEVYLPTILDPNHTHTFGEWTTVTASTCTTDGLRERTCSECGKKETEVITASHSYGDWIVDTASSCTVDGSRHRVCSVCGEVDTEVIAALGHSYGAWQTDTQKHWKECSVCGAHTEEGTHTFDQNNVCTVCGITDMVTRGLAFEKISGAEEYKVTGIGTAEGNDLVIPDVYENLPVTTIGANAFLNCSFLTSVTIPDSIKAIESKAFDGCVGLTKVIISDLNKWLGIDFALSTSNPLSLAGKIYLRGEEITVLTVPDEITVVKNYAFYGCDSITKLNMSNNVTKLSTGCFASCANLTEAYVSDGVTEIATNTFDGCNSLVTIRLPYIGTMPSSTIDAQKVFGAVFGYTVSKGSDYSANSVKQYENSAGYFYYHIPDTLRNVTIGQGSIYKNSFTLCENLTSIVLEDGVTRIESKAFYGCTLLKELVLSDNIVSYSSTSFDACGGNDKFNTYGNSYYLGTKTNDYAVLVRAVKTSITSVTVHNDVKIIMSKAFTDCASITSVTTPIISSITAIPKTNLVSLVFTSGESIAASAYNNCTALTSVTICDSITSIGASAFYGCSALSEINMGKGVNSIGNDAFGNCSAINNLYIKDLPSWCKITFGNMASNPINPSCNAYFNGAVINELVIPAEITEIKPYAFINMGITSLNVHAGVTSIGESAFSGCSSLVSVILPFAGKNVSSNVPFGYIFGTTAYTGGTATDQNNIGSNSYYYIPTTLRTVSILGGDIKSYAFYNCTLLTQILLPDDVTVVEKDSFYNNTSLNFNTYDNAYYVGSQTNDYALLLKAKDNSITSCEINADTRIIYARAFATCRSITDIIVPASVKTLEEASFTYCESLKAVTVSGAATIKGSAFSNCTGLTTVSLAEGLISIGKWAFNSCTSLQSIIIPSTVKDIGEGAFNSCSALKNIILPDGVAQISNQTFQDCTALQTIVIPGTVKTINYNAFGRCDGLTKVYYKGNADEYALISIVDEGAGFGTAPKYYYSETKPTVSGNYWHYNELNAVVEW